MLSIILHDTCIHHSNVCDIYRYTGILLFNLYIYVHAISLYCILFILLEDYTSSSIFSGYILHYILILDTRNRVMSLVKKPLTLYCEKIQRQGKYK